MTETDQTIKLYSETAFDLFISRLTDHRFELVAGQIVPVHETAALDSSLVDYVLSAEFDETQITKIFEMATAKHDIIVSNLHGKLYMFSLQNKEIRIYSQGTHIRIDITGSSRMPDIAVVSKKDEKRNALHQILNPTVLVEVLSKSTQAKDKNEKLDEYQTIESLEEYVLISQDQPQVTKFSKIDSWHWNQEILKGLDKVLHLQSIGFEISLQEIYAAD
jgi:Uma2 family endonuclease